MGKLNCWEFKGCGREPGGAHVAELGICPVTTRLDFDGAHGGKNAGRACWIVPGSLCGGSSQGTHAQKPANCGRCDFMNVVRKEEERSAPGFSHTRSDIEKMLETMYHLKRKRQK